MLGDGSGAEGGPADATGRLRPLFRSFLHGGFECASQRLPDGRQLDLTATTGHDWLAAWDYRTLRRHGIHSARDGLRWHRIEAGAPGRYDWSSALPMLRAARDSGMQVIWDLLHYGWPAGLDIWKPAFVERFARFAAAAAELVQAEQGDAVPFYCPVNESSFWSFAGGDIAMFAPCARGRGFELKCQLVRAELAAIAAIREVEPAARFVHADPIIHVAHGGGGDPDEAEGHRQSQFQRWDLLAGRLWPQLGGSEEFLDILGLNYYGNNQWIHGGPPIARGHPLHRPLSAMLVELAERYPAQPLYLAETGAEGDRRVPWLREVAEEMLIAMQRGVPLHGFCLYPITDYPGWGDDRPCPTGLLGVPLALEAARELQADYLEEVLLQHGRLTAQHRDDDGRRSAIPPRGMGALAGVAPGAAR